MSLIVSDSFEPYFAGREELSRARGGQEKPGPRDLSPKKQAEHLAREREKAIARSSGGLDRRDIGHP